MRTDIAVLNRVAAFVGAHALPVYFALLAVLLGLAFFGWWAFQRWMLPRIPVRASAITLRSGGATGS